MQAELIVKYAPFNCISSTQPQAIKNNVFFPHVFVVENGLRLKHGNLLTTFLEQH